MPIGKYERQPQNMKLYWKAYMIVKMLSIYTLSTFKILLGLESFVKIYTYVDIIAIWKLELLTL